MYKVLLYQDKNGKSPIDKFIYKASKSVQIKISKQIKYLELFGLTRENPNLKKITGTQLWEVRILGKDNVRIICVAIVGNEIIIVNIFNKKKNKTPIKELKISLMRYKDCVDI